MLRRVLIADDHEPTRSLMQSQIERLDGVVVCACVTNGVEAVEMATALRPDILILDILLPELSGIQVAGALKSSLPGAKIILFSLYADAVGAHIVKTLGVKLVSKTDGLRSLLRALQEILDAQALDEGLAFLPRERKIDIKQLDSVTQQLYAPLTRCSRDLKYMWVNEYYAKLLKRPVNKIVGHSILDVIGKSAFDLLRPHFDQVLRGVDVSYKLELDYQSAGHRHIAASYKALFDGNGSPDGWLAYVEDITPQVSLPVAG